LSHRASVPVGLEPVAVAVRSNSEVWVVNHLSDSVSVVHLGSDGQSGEVVRTLLVGDEPRDIVFAGSAKNRAFITTAHRGQNMAVNPVSGKIYVSNTEALNLAHFEGPGIFAGHSVRGHLHESRITVLSPGGTSTPRHLNKHIDYSSCCAPVPNTENEKSLAIPTGMAITADGSKLYVAALGSDKVGVFSTAALENDTFTPSTANQIPVSGGGPTGLVLHESKHRLYVLTRFDNAISVINTSTQAETAHVRMYNPEPPSVTNGRRFLYDASLSSAHGDSACASCHVFGDFDSLAWDLGNPDASVLHNPGPFTFPTVGVFSGTFLDPDFHPMKGPMATQSLRGMANHGPMHWRGDRTGGNDEATSQPDSGTFNERAAFKKFQNGFTDLLGRHAHISPEDMDAFTEFMLQVTYPPNPIRNLDSSLTPLQALGRDTLLHELTDPVLPTQATSCEGCHTLSPSANPGSDFPGYFGTRGESTHDNEAMVFKIPHFRNMYQKVGMFGMAPIVIAPPIFVDNVFQGDQVRGVGFIHDGSFDTIFRFTNIVTFSELAPNAADGLPFTPAGLEMRKGIEAFLLAFDSNMAPIVGQQTTLTGNSPGVVGSRINLLRARADAGECDLVAKGRLLGQDAGYFYHGGGLFKTDRKSTPIIADSILRLLVVVTNGSLTYTCAPRGSGRRIGIDRDLDGALDGDEDAAGSDPADPNSLP
jgi:sugar lactone lactonase YvrE